MANIPGSFSRLLAAAAVLILGFFATPLAAGEIPLANASFESPAIPGGEMRVSGAADWNFRGTVWTERARAGTAPETAAEGNQYVTGRRGWIELFTQGGTLQANTRYVLQARVYALGSGEDFEAAFDIYNPATSWERKDYAVYRPTWAPDLVDFLPQQGQWNDVRVVMDAEDYAALIGQPFRIRFAMSYYALDDVRLIQLTPGETEEAFQNTYYIDATEGRDENDGLSAETAWQSFTNINARVLRPGEKVLLKRGCEWRDELHLRGQGNAANPIELGAYGDVLEPRPLIRRRDLAFDRCITIQQPAYWKVSSVDCRDAKLGLYLRYHNSYHNESVEISNCHFENISDPTLDPADHYYELAWSDAIWLGGHIWNEAMNDATVLDGLTIVDCTFNNCAHGFGTAWYYPPASRQRLRNLYMADCVAVDCANGAFALMCTADSLVERVASIGGGADNWAGSTLGFAQSCRDVVIDNCEFGYMDRRESADGVGFDFEGDNHNMTFSNNVVHDCSGSSLLVLSTLGLNLGINIENCVFYNNAENPWNSEINSEVFCGNPGNTGTVSNNGLYRRDNTLNYFTWQL